METAEQRRARWALRAAAGNLRHARWYAGGGGNVAAAGQHALDAMMFLGVAVEAGAKTNGAAWKRCYRLANSVVYGLATRSFCARPAGKPILTF